jgi:hypothetical protein
MTYLEEKQIAELELCVIRLQEYIRHLRGEKVDLTGVGPWRMFCDALERAMDVKIIAKEE